ncbi:MAG: type VI secretion system baseplate subunit TssK [Pseudomonadota bacterium]|nr:type VI secretion system baseplate subunit TssK [Pseudomonadota bacterium]
MHPSAKVLWGEGLFLRPQHFQMQDQYHEARLAETMRLLHPYAFGIKHVMLDQQMLSSGLLAFTDIQLVWPDGDLFQAPAQDLLPAPQQLDGSNLADQVIVYLATHALRVGHANVTDPDKGRHARFMQSSTQADDLFTSASPTHVLTLQRHARIVLEGQDMDDLITLPIARIKRNAAGIYEQDHNFIPPLLHLTSSPCLLALLRRLLSVIQTKVSALYNHHREPGQNILEFRSGDIASFWLLHTLNAGYSSLMHLLQNAGLHPERLHQELLRLTSSLLTFSKAYHLEDLPAYTHFSPAKGFHQLDQMIRDLLDTVISSRFLTIPLQETKPAYFIGHLQSDRIDASARLYLSISSSLPVHELVSSVPIRFKVGSPDDVEQRVLAALSGVTLTHVSQVPAAIPIRPGCTYFAIEPHGALYEKTLQAESICIYVPTGFDDLKIELMAIIQ